MSLYLESLHRHRQQHTSQTTEIIAKGHLLLMELKDFKRTFNFDSIHLSSSLQSGLQEEEEGEGEGEGRLEEVMQWQQRRWELARYVYSMRLRELNLRS